jgi:C4-dicarboxylate transporter, DctQ subunit
MRKRLLPEEVVCGVLLMLMVLLVVVQVAGRYLFSASISFTEELVRYAFVWITFLGAGAAAFRGRHLAVSGVTRFLPWWAQRSVNRTKWVLALALGGILIWFGSRVVVLQVRTEQTTAVLGIPMWLVGLAVPLCAAVFCVRVAMSPFRAMDSESPQAPLSDSGDDT